MDKAVAVAMKDGNDDLSRYQIPSVHQPVATRGLQSSGYVRLTVTESKGHGFEIWLRTPTKASRLSWEAAVVSRGMVTYARAYVTDGVMRASVPIADPYGHLLFRATMDGGKPMPVDGFQSKFGAL